MCPHLGKRGEEGGGGDEASSALGKMDQARARFRRAVEENFEQAQTDLEKPRCQ